MFNYSKNIFINMWTERCTLLCGYTMLWSLEEQELGSRGLPSLHNAVTCNWTQGDQLATESLELCSVNGDNSQSDTTKSDATVLRALANWSVHLVIAMRNPRNQPITRIFTYAFVETCLQIQSWTIHTTQHETFLHHCDNNTSMQNKKKIQHNTITGTSMRRKYN